MARPEAVRVTIFNQLYSLLASEDAGRITDFKGSYEEFVGATA